MPSTTDSILLSVKKLLGMPEEYDAFDQDIIIHVNTVFANLCQMGVGPENGYSIIDSSATWSDFVGDDKRLEMIKSYTYMKVRLMFDPPTNAALLDSLTRNANELEWRLYTLKGGY